MTGQLTSGFVPVLALKPEVDGLIFDCYRDISQLFELREYLNRSEWRRSVRPSARVRALDFAPAPFGHRSVLIDRGASL